MQKTIAPLPVDELPCPEAAEWLRINDCRRVGPELYSDGRRTIIRLAVPRGGCLLLACPPPEPASPDEPAY